MGKERIVVFEESVGLWVAVWLEHFIVAQADTMEDALYALSIVIKAQKDLVKRNPHYTEIDPAPQRYWEMLNDS